MAIKVRLRNDVNTWNIPERSDTSTPVINSGIWYFAYESPIIYDQQTFVQIKYYIIECDDGKTRKFDMNKFITMDEWRENRLRSLLDD
jgi:hypothetical protein